METHSLHSAQEGHPPSLLEMNVHWCEKSILIPEEQQWTMWRWQSKTSVYLY